MCVCVCWVFGLLCVVWLVSVVVFWGWPHPPRSAHASLISFRRDASLSHHAFSSWPLGNKSNGLNFYYISLPFLPKTMRFMFSWTSLRYARKEWFHGKMYISPLIFVYFLAIWDGFSGINIDFFKLFCALAFKFEIVFAEPIRDQWVKSRFIAVM